MKKLSLILSLAVALTAPAILPARAEDAPPAAVSVELDAQPVIIERATTDSAVEVAHKTTGRKIAEKLRAKGFSENFTIVAISTLPIVELRGAVPVGHILLPDTDKSTRLGRDDLARSARIYFWAVLGNMIPVPFILLLLGPISNICMKVPIGKKFFDWLFTRTRRKTAEIEKYEFWGLAIFVAIPLPATGAWTGAAAGWLLGLNFWRSMLSILFGVAGAGVIMTALSLLGWIGAGIALVALMIFFGGILARALRKVRA